MKKIFLYASIILAAGLLFTNIYNSLVDAKSWANAFPSSVETARLYYKTSNPGNFFRLFSPINQLLGLLCIILFWKAGKKARLFLLMAIFMYVSADIFTFAYFYPRNSIIFKADLNGSAEEVKNALQEWSIANWFRSLIALAGIIFSSLALNTIYKRDFAADKL
ncbi:MAG: DUF1772 domain-containing protein [Ginsengibacter sp.]